jgi:hypothetical protein
LLQSVPGYLLSKFAVLRVIGSTPIGCTKNLHFFLNSQIKGGVPFYFSDLN